MKVLLSEMTTHEIKEKAKPNTVVVVPVGSMEQHGPHLPLETDSRIVEEIATRAAQRVADRIGVLVTPTVWLGLSGQHIDFSGTLTLDPHCFIDVVTGIIKSLEHHGFRRMVLLNGHGGNMAALDVIARTFESDVKTLVVSTAYWRLADEGRIEAVRESGPGGMAHAGEFETSCMLALRPELVHLDRMIRRVPKWNTRYFAMDMQIQRRVQLTHKVSDFSDSGVFGDPMIASAAKGDEFLKAVIKGLTDFLVEFASWDLETLCD